jgi:hypothetical protein
MRTPQGRQATVALDQVKIQDGHNILPAQRDDVPNSVESWVGDPG